MSEGTFTGFPARAQATPIPNAFFARLLPELTDPAELGVTLYVFFLLHRKKGYPRFLTYGELAADATLASFLTRACADASVAQALRSAVDASLKRGVFLRLRVEHDGREDELLFLNAPADRRALELVQSGRTDLGRALPEEAPEPRAPASNLFALYEQNIGTLNPMVAEELAEAERLYPREWLEAAFREAAALNRRSWRYISRILERWAAEGPTYEKAGRDSADDFERRYLSGKYGRIIKR